MPIHMAAAPEAGTPGAMVGRARWACCSCGTCGGAQAMAPRAKAVGGAMFAAYMTIMPVDAAMLGAARAPAAPPAPVARAEVAVAGAVEPELVGVAVVVLLAGARVCMVAVVAAMGWLLTRLMGCAPEPGPARLQATEAPVPRGWLRR